MLMVGFQDRFRVNPVSLLKFVACSWMSGAFFTGQLVTGQYHGVLEVYIVAFIDV
jgi:hypothetical protein